MAARKKKPIEVQKWFVVANGQEVAVEAEGMELQDGALVFTDAGGGIVEAYADGGWASVKAAPDLP